MPGTPRASCSCSPSSNMVGEDTFYEAATERDARFRELVAAVAVSDPDWAARLIGWLRTGANLRSASLVAAAEFVRPGSLRALSAAIGR